MANRVLVIPDSHEDASYITKAATIARNNNISTVYHVGDWAEAVKQDDLKKISEEIQPEIMQRDDVQKAQMQSIFLRQQLSGFIKETYGGNSEAFYSDLMARRLPSQIMDAYDSFAQTQDFLKSVVNDETFREEARRRLSVYNEPLKALKNMGIKTFSVLGNHDPWYLEDILEGVTFIGGEGNDPLASEGIVGHTVPFPPVGLPGLEHAAPYGKGEDDDNIIGPDMGWGEKLGINIFSDTDWQDAGKNSKWKQRVDKLQSKHTTNTVLCHHGPRIGNYFTGKESLRENYPSAGGLTAFAKQNAKWNNRVTYICGHEHGGRVYNYGNQLIINPGVNHFAAVDYEGDDVVQVLLYKRENPHEAVDILTKYDLNRKGKVWNGGKDETQDLVKRIVEEAKMEEMLEEQYRQAA